MLSFGVRVCLRRTPQMKTSIQRQLPRKQARTPSTPTSTSPIPTTPKRKLSQLTVRDRRPRLLRARTKLRARRTRRRQSGRWLLRRGGITSGRKLLSAWTSRNSESPRRKERRS